MATKRIKATAATYVCQNRAQVIESMKRLGDLQRQDVRIAVDAGDAIAKIKEDAESQRNKLKPEIDTLQLAIQTWCEANRDSILDKNCKTADFGTGVAGWRIDPPSVNVTGEKAVIQLLKNMDLGRFIRLKESVDKEAMKAEPDAIKGIEGIKYTSNVEKFFIIPADTE